MTGAPVSFTLHAGFDGIPVVTIDGNVLEGRIVGASVVAERGEIPRLGVTVIGPAHLAGEAIVTVHEVGDDGDSPQDIAAWLANIDPDVLERTVLDGMSLGDSTMPRVLTVLREWASGR